MQVALQTCRQHGMPPEPSHNQQPMVPASSCDREDMLNSGHFGSSHFGSSHFGSRRLWRTVEGFLVSPFAPRSDVVQCHAGDGLLSQPLQVGTRCLWATSSPCSGRGVSSGTLRTSGLVSGQQFRSLGAHQFAASIGSQVSSIGTGTGQGTERVGRHIGAHGEVPRRDDQGSSCRAPTSRVQRDSASQGPRPCGRNRAVEVTCCHGRSAPGLCRCLPQICLVGPICRCSIGASQGVTHLGQVPLGPMFFSTQASPPTQAR